MNLIVWLSLFFPIDLFYCDQAEDTPGSSSIDLDKISTTLPDEKWIGDAIKDVAYYLRAYKFNEWDRRYLHEKPQDSKVIGYYGSFPEPPLRTIHWKVYENCHSDFYQCVAYLHSIVESAPLTRQDDTTTVLNDNGLQINKSLEHDLDLECKKGLESSEATGLPFDGPLEKFQWRTSAAYYMCWYTMLETPALSILEELCDNFANCLDPNLGTHNHDPRSDDSISFACATYSFCPDPCCPLKYVKDITVCRNTEVNPCFAENSAHPENQACKFDRKYNRMFNDIILNKWNISCHCEDKGFIWKSQFGICFDVNECVTGEHECDGESEDCLNLPGTYTCICRWDYSFSIKANKCVYKPVISFDKHDITEHYFNFINIFNRIRNYLGF